MTAFALACFFIALLTLCAIAAIIVGGVYFLARAAYAELICPDELHVIVRILIDTPAESLPA